MYQTNNKTKYYIYNCKSEKYIHVCENLQELIEYVASFNYRPWLGNKRANRFFDDFNCTMNDVKNAFDWHRNSFIELREYVVFDSIFRIVDVRMYANEILSYKGSMKRKPKKGSLAYNYEKSKPEFRKGPVPYTGSGHWHYYRRPRTTQEIRQNSIPEYGEFVRKKRKYIPTSWDDIGRNISRSWKDQSKKKKQWM